MLWIRMMHEYIYILYTFISCRYKLYKHKKNTHLLLMSRQSISRESSPSLWWFQTKVALSFPQNVSSQMSHEHCRQFLTWAQILHTQPRLREERSALPSKFPSVCHPSCILADCCTPEKTVISYVLEKVDAKIQTNPAFDQRVFDVILSNIHELCKTIWVISHARKTFVRTCKSCRTQRTTVFCRDFTNRTPQKITASKCPKCQTRPTFHNALCASLSHHRLQVLFRQSASWRDGAKFRLCCDNIYFFYFWTFSHRLKCAKE